MCNYCKLKTIDVVVVIFIVIGIVVVVAGGRRWLEVVVGGGVGVPSSTLSSMCPRSSHSQRTFAFYFVHSFRIEFPPNGKIRNVYFECATGCVCVCVCMYGFSNSGRFVVLGVRRISETIPHRVRTDCPLKTYNMHF